MIDYYTIKEEAPLKKASKDVANWLVMSNATDEDRTEIIKEFRLPEDIFAGSEKPEEVSRLERIRDGRLSDVYSLVLTDLSHDADAAIEERLKPITFIFSTELVITYVPRNSNFVERLLAKHGEKIHNPETLITYSALMIYSHYVQELLAVKKTIDELDESARKTTENKALFRLADTERTLVYLDHTLTDQKGTLKQLWDKESFIEKLNNDKLLFDVQLRQKHANKLVHLYRDLLETVGGLFSDMMDNNLNHLMKYLDSAALIISIPALVAGIWGMNVGGLPGKSSGVGFIIVMVLAVLVAGIFAMYLRKKDYSK